MHPLGEVIRLSYPLAFLAGLVSFLSPCVFPLVPAYAGYLGGRAGDAVAVGGRLQPALAGEAAVLGGPPPGRAAGARAPLLANGVAFVIGFSAVFVTFFYVLTALDSAFLARHRREIDLAAGVVVVLLALQTLGLVRLPGLMRERRRLLAPGRVGLLPSLLLGVTFAAGWTPCIGPQLASILAVAQQRDFAGLPVMLVYCLGLALPFLLVAALADRLQGAIRAVNRHLGAVNLVAGALLLVVGVLLISDSITVLNRFVPQSAFAL